MKKKHLMKVGALGRGLEIDCEAMRKDRSMSHLEPPKSSVPKVIAVDVQHCKLGCASHDN